MNKYFWHIVTLFLIICTYTFAQHTILSSFSGFQNKETVHLQWKIKSGSQCQGMNIERSSDTTVFQKIGTIEGVCGSSVAEMFYSFTDNSPIPNTINYYRLELGLQGFSDIIAVTYYAFNENGYLLLTESGSKNSTVLFNRLKNKTYKYHIYDLTGKLRSVGSVTGNRFNLSHDKTGKGIFIFIIFENNYPTIKGKFYI